MRGAAPGVGGGIAATLAGGGPMGAIVGLGVEAILGKLIGKKKKAPDGSKTNPFYMRNPRQEDERSSLLNVTKNLLNAAATPGIMGRHSANQTALGVRL